MNALDSKSRFKRISKKQLWFLLVAVVLSLVVFLAMYPPAQVDRSMSPRDICLNNLRFLDGVKQEWALEKKMPTNSVPSEKDLLPFFTHLSSVAIPFPTCPLGGKYSINAVADAPTCTITNHVLP